jgi:hypothetical protein
MKLSKTISFENDMKQTFVKGLSIDHQKPFITVSVDEEKNLGYAVT